MPAHTCDDLHRLRLIQVQSWQDIGKHLRRIVFHSPELADYPFRCTGAPFKLLLPHEGQRAPVLPLPTKSKSGKPSPSMHRAIQKIRCWCPPQNTC